MNVVKGSQNVDFLKMMNRGFFNRRFGHFISFQYFFYHFQSFVASYHELTASDHEIQVIFPIFIKFPR